MPIYYPAQVGAFMTRVLESGTGAHKVVFVHGLAARADRWCDVLERFGELGARAYAVDLPGHGFAAKGREVECSVPGFAAFLGEFLKWLPKGPTVVVGTSIGGQACAWLIATTSVPVDALVLVDTMGFAPLGQERRSRLAAGLTSLTVDGVRTRLASLLGRAPCDAAVKEEYLVNTSHGADLALGKLATYVRDHIDRDLVADRLSAASMPPTLVIWGENDPALPLALGNATAQALPGSDFRVMRGCGHAPYLEQPEMFISTVAGFLQDRLPTFLP